MVIVLAFRSSCAGGDLTNHGLSSFVFLTRRCMLCSDSKCQDHWHDVLVGSLLGTVLAYFSYRQYYPSLASELSHRPYSPRIPREPEEGLPLHHRYDSSVDQSGVQTSGPALTRRYNDDVALEEAYELDGTVQRHTPPLEEVWREGAPTVVQEAPAAHHKPTADPIR